MNLPTLDAMHLSSSLIEFHVLMEAKRHEAYLITCHVYTNFQVVVHSLHTNNFSYPNQGIQHYYDLTIMKRRAVEDFYPYYMIFLHTWCIWHVAFKKFLQTFSYNQVIVNEMICFHSIKLTKNPENPEKLDILQTGFKIRIRNSGNSKSGLKKIVVSVIFRCFVVENR